MDRGERVRSRIVSAVERDARAHGFTLSLGQRSALDELVRVADHVVGADRASTDTRGVYLWGSVGRGKSWLLDAFFRALPTRSKTRVHFHGFLEALQRRIHAHRPAPDAVRLAIADLTRGARVLYFDEFHVHDSGDAILLTRLLEHLTQTDTVLLATSNYPPDQLMIDSPWRHVMVDAIAAIEQRMRVVEVGGERDFRGDARTAPLRQNGRTTSGGFSSGAWLTTPTGTDWADQGLRPPRDEEHTEVVVAGRPFSVLAARPDELWMTFTQLCVVPTSPIEYVDWIARYRRWIVTGVPSFEGVDVQAQQRFLTVIDMLSDAGTRLLISSDLSPAEFRGAAFARPDASRMLSRLRLLRDPVADQATAPDARLSP